MSIMVGVRMRTMVVAAAALAWPLAARAQDPQAAQEHLTAMAQGLEESQAQLAHYEWIETIVTSVNGEEKSRVQNQVYYGADGVLQKVPIGDPPAADEGRSHGLRARAAKNKKEEIAEFMQKAAARIDEYVPPTPELLQACVTAGKVAVEVIEPGRRVRLEFHDYLSPGDTVALDLDLTNNYLLGAQVSTYVDSPEDPVDLTVTFGVLNDGTTYPHTIVLDAPSMEVSVRTENTGYKKSGT